MTEPLEISKSIRRQLVFTVKDRCRVCYTCLRECPAKAIKIINGQAEVIHERCIGCGNCVKVCSQDAKVFLRQTEEVFKRLSSGRKVIACIAPSFPAEFPEIDDPQVLVGMLRKLGFHHVTEVAFGADMVAKSYKELLLQEKISGHISSDCPAIVYFIEHYYPELVPRLAPIVSPMVAMARIVKKKYGNDSSVIFIGPCIAKKAETTEVDEVLTFRELRDMFQSSKINPEEVQPSPFDPPYGGRGAIFPISGGLMQTSGIGSELKEGDILIAEGRVNIRDAIREFEEGGITTRHLELLCCEGCIMGPGMSPEGKKFARKNHISRYVNSKLSTLDSQTMDRQEEEFKHVDFSQHFIPKDRRISRPYEESIRKVLLSMGKAKPKDYLNCGACGYDTCEEHAVAILQGLAENEMCLPFTIEKLHNYIMELNISQDKLASVQQALQQSEKLASLGQLSAGIAHELNNPLGVITMYSNILMDEAGADSPMRSDLELIVEQSDRCKKIVGGLLNFARKNQVNLQRTDINLLMASCVNAVICPDDVNIVLESDLKDPIGFLDYDQMQQVFTNLIKNAIEAMPGGGTLNINIDGDENELRFSFRDEGTGISPENMSKLFTPFFTTKAIGKGTGLGLPIVYGIVKMHKGNFNVESNADPSKGQTGTKFFLSIPRVGVNN